MLESIIGFYQSLPLLVQWTVGFIFNVIIVRGIIANEIMAELEKYGVVKGHVVEGIRNGIYKLLWSDPRKAAILAHEIAKAKNTGHATKDVLECPENSCRAVFAG